MLSLANNYPKPLKPKRRLWLSGFCLLWALFLALAIINRQNIFDWWALRGYHPPIAITSLASQDTMTPYATKVFKVNHPQLETIGAFSKNCPNNGGEQTIVLGCYHPNQAGIFLLNETDPRLKGVEEVTAAHELLHAVYDRLSSSSKAKVNAMLLAYYQQVHNPRILAEIASYRRTEPHAVVNEMHSVFGTEVANLPAPLAKYYAQYFTNRAKIVAYASQYQAAFSSRQTIVNQDDATLGIKLAQINALKASVNAQYSQLSAKQVQLNNLKNQNNLSAFNTGVTSYNQQVDQYNASTANLRSLVASYNTLLSNRNALALSENQLYQELSGNQPTLLSKN